MKIIEFDVVFISYDEPNADMNYADLCTKVPWALRVHGVDGSDAAHKAAANLSATDWFVTIDADNIVDPKFFNIDLDISDPGVYAFTWAGHNVINGLRYGNGGPKVWHKDFVLTMKTHEAAESAQAQVDFCWETGYKTFTQTYSDSIVTASPLQAWRAGFREGVKMTLLDGVKVPPMEIEQQVWWHNIHRLRMWSTVGSHEENGLFAVYGTRLGTYMANCTDWDYVQVRDFNQLANIYEEKVKQFENDEAALIVEIKRLGEIISRELGFHWVYLDPEQSKYTRDLYIETLNLNSTYYKTQK